MNSVGCRYSLFRLQPDTFVAAGLLDLLQAPEMRRYFVFAGPDDAQRWTIGAELLLLLCNRGFAAAFITQHQAGLPSRHQQIDVREYLRVLQCAVQFTLAVVYFITFAECVEVVLLARMFF